MKKVISILTTLLLIWGVWLFVDYIKGYQNEGKLLIDIKTETADKYTKRCGLGYCVKLYDYNPKNLKNGQVLKEFTIFDIVVSKEIAKVNYE